MSQVIHPVMVFTNGQPELTCVERAVKDANAVLVKNTNVQLNIMYHFALTEFHADGQVGWQPGPFPIHIRAYPSSTGRSTDSFTTTYVDSSGAMVLTDIYASPNDIEYLVYFLLHYFAHAHGAGIGEYYGSSNIGPFRSYRDDGTWNEHDPYWGDVDQEWRSEFQFDPLMRQVPVRLMRYSSLTAAIINGGYRVCSNEPPEASDKWVSLDQYSWYRSTDLINKLYGPRIGEHDVPVRHYTKWDLQYQKLILGRDVAQFDAMQITVRKPTLSGRKVDNDTFDFCIETPRACSLVRVAEGQKAVMQHYPIAGHYVYRIRNAGLVKESEWRLE